jgi:hypothetical protein
MDWTVFFDRAPYISALIVIVWMFLRHLEKRDEMLKEISAQCHLQQEKCGQAMIENTKTLERVSEAIRNCNTG